MLACDYTDPSVATLVGTQILGRAPGQHDRRAHRGTSPQEGSCRQRQEGALPRSERSTSGVRQVPRVHEWRPKGHRRGRPQTHQQTRTPAHPHTRTTSRLPARTHGHTDIRIHAHTHTRTDAHTHTRTHAHTHTRTREHANTHLTPRAQCASSLCCDVPMQVPERVVRMLPRPQRMQSTVWIELTTDTLEWLPKLTRISLLCFRISSPPPL